jgi:hypothetical protein
VLLCADCLIVCYSPHSSKVLSAGRDWAG